MIVILLFINFLTVKAYAYGSAFDAEDFSGHYDISFLDQMEIKILGNSKAIIALLLIVIMIISAIGAVFLANAICGLITLYLGKQKGNDDKKQFFWGFFLGGIGIIIVLFSGKKESKNEKIVIHQGSKKNITVSCPHCNTKMTYPIEEMYETHLCPTCYKLIKTKRD